MSQKSGPDTKTWMYIGGAVLAVLVAVLVAISVSGGSSDELTGGSEIDSMLKDIPSEGFVLGKADAQVTIIEYVDPQCPHCAEASKSIIPDLVERHVKTGNVKLQMAPLAMTGVPENGTKANRAVWAAGQQGKAWNLMEMLLYNQGAQGTGWLDDDMITQAAEAVGLDMGKFDTDRKSAESDRAVQESQQLAQVNNVGGTPTFSARHSTQPLQVTVENTTPAGFDAAISAVNPG